MLSTARIFGQTAFIFLFFHEPDGYDHVVSEPFRSHFGSSMFLEELVLVALILLAWLCLALINQFLEDFE